RPARGAGAVLRSEARADVGNDPERPRPPGLPGWVIEQDETAPSDLGVGIVPRDGRGLPARIGVMHGRADRGRERREPARRGLLLQGKLRAHLPLPVPPGLPIPYP